MVVDAVGDARAEDPAHALDDRLTSRIRVFAGNRHCFEVVLAARRVQRQQKRWRVHPAFGAAVVPPAALGDAHEAGGRAVAEPSRAEMDADPDVSLGVLEQVDVVIAAADGAELLTGELQESTLFADRRCGDPLENRMIGNRVVVGAADPETDPALDLSRQPPPVADVRRAEIGPRREVAAGDVVSDP